MLKLILFIIGFLVVFVSVSMFIISQSEEISTKEGFLYSAIGCTSVYQKLSDDEKAQSLLNLINNFSEREEITDVQTGYIDRFIKLIEKKWEKDHVMAEKNCLGIYKTSLEETKPLALNPVAQTVKEYLEEIEIKKANNPLLKLQTGTHKE